MKPKRSLAQRSITSISWNMIASAFLVIVGFIRSMLLARWIPVATFGMYGWAGSLVSLTAIITDFGMGGAFLHRTSETEDEEAAAQVHFTLKMILSAIWVTLLIGYAFVLAEGETRIVLVALTLTNVGAHLSHTPRLILARRVVHRRLALYQVVNAGLSSILAVGLAWSGVGLWALLVTDFVTFILNIVLFYVWRPVWRPKFTWNPSVVRYFLSFGGRKFTADALLRALDRVDDLWVGAYLGDVAMGFYSRAYTFATYPRKILAHPVNLVTGGTYAELKEDRKRLSQAFYRVNAFLIRSGFLIAGGLALIAPEFIRIVLTEKWTPMLNVFRLMLAYTMFDPIKSTISLLFFAVGKPEHVTRARFGQFSVMLVGLFVLGPRFGISGVALVVDLMLIIGIMILLFAARKYVDFSPIRLFAIPLLALTAGLSLAYTAIAAYGTPRSDWYAGFVKVSVFVGTYSLISLIGERKQFLEMIRYILKYVG